MPLAFYIGFSGDFHFDTARILQPLGAWHGKDPHFEDPNLHGETSINFWVENGALLGSWFFGLVLHGSVNGTCESAFGLL